MWFWWFMFICDLLIPLLMIFAGRMMWKYTPKNINGIIGYRTSRSIEVIGTFGAILCTIQVIILLISILPTEKALKRNFTEDGVPK